ncbi:FAD-binding domain-containing protein [Aureobasidium pullulans]|uniref:Delta(24)-sterol reductase n=1 Tax=Aureobasidium pullulans TaxID=5580 RepID=A0A4S9CE35_AURPU|nr:FAD-binding domain-containing protein [Aureobasidium pullulans]
MDKHNEVVKQISARLKYLHSRKEPFRIFHGSTNSTRNYSVDRNRMIDTSSLNHVLGVDKSSKTALVEPNVPMDKLVEATLPFGLVPPVVMEFKGITAGGGFSGTGGESSSFKHGSFDCTVNWIEILLADGEITKASPKLLPDLFYGSTSSLGTLGVTTLMEVQLVDAKRYVETTYTPCGSLEETLEKVKTASADLENDYVDGFLMSLNRGIVVTGRLTSSVSHETRVQRFQGARDPWFYMNADRTTRKARGPVTEAVPLADYLFRYDRGAFWMGKYAFNYFMVPFNRITRWVLDDFMQTSTMYHALHASGHMQQYIIQDLAIPAANVKDFINAVDQIFDFYPLWLCPMKPWTQQSSFHPHGIDTNLLINVGVWGPNGASTPEEGIERNRKLESLVKQHGGRKWLYAQAFYTESEFWDIYDETSYLDLRKKYRAEYLPSAFDKACAIGNGTSQTGQPGWTEWATQKAWGIWPVSGVYGVLQTLVSKEYLLKK